MESGESAARECACDSAMRMDKPGFSMQTKQDVHPKGKIPEECFHMLISRTSHSDL